MNLDSEAAGKQALHKLKGSSIKGVQVIFASISCAAGIMTAGKLYRPGSIKISEKRQKNRRRDSNIEIIDTSSKICDIYAANLQKLKPEAI